MLKLTFYVPQQAAEQVKTAVFKAGAGQIGPYSHCAWQTLGAGQFKPLAGASPSIGSVGELEQVAEVRVECLCDEAYAAAVKQALIDAHPYEVPAFDFVKLAQV